MKLRQKRRREKALLLLTSPLVSSVLCVRICVFYCSMCLAGWPLFLEAAQLRCGSELLSDLLFVCGDRGLYLGTQVFVFNNRDFHTVLCCIISCCSVSPQCTVFNLHASIARAVPSSPKILPKFSLVGDERVHLHQHFVSTCASMWYVCPCRSATLTGHAKMYEIRAHLR
ncbi:hypothetical protein GOODEAATRI_021134 [Goodea atripinnis]|uniref:Secreted protein n=1 Tax=Goodea atripinnis TaxID=208336 RepID=A0ABV0P6L6_9TELE